MKRNPQYPPETEDIQLLADFFDHTDITKLDALEEIPQKPKRRLVSVTVRLPEEDVAELKRRAARMGLSYTSLVRAAVRHFVEPRKL